VWPHELKLLRARQHLDELKVELDRWLNVDGCAVTVERDGKGPFYVVRAKRLRPLDVDDIAVRVGDFLQNARASLDYLAHELGDIGAGPRGMTSEQSARSAYPIVADEDAEGYAGLGLDRFRDRVRQDLSTLTPEAVAFIERHQPFQDGEVWRSHRLWALQDLARIDRHRFLHVAVVRSGDIRRDASRWSNCRIRDLEVEEGIVYFGDDEDPIDYPEAKDTAVLARFTGEPVTPGKEMHMHFLNALTIGWDEDTAPPDLAGEEVIRTLDMIDLKLRMLFSEAKSLLKP
jgi:hypothetical protein